MRNLRAERATDVAALADNARSIAHAADGREVIAVVKADAYGNGLVRCARTLKGEAAMFAVATASEAKRLLDAKICLPVLIMGALSKDELRAAALLDGASLAVSSLAEAAYLDRLAAAAGRRIPVHIAVDSGMHRFGFAPDPKTIGLVATFRGVAVEGIYTHYARPDDDAFTRRQCDVFCDVVERLKARGMNFRFVHAAASGAVCRGVGLCGNAVRVGLALYGCGDLPGLRPVATVTARVLCVRTLERGDGIGYGAVFAAPCRMRVAVVSAGYADGVPLSLSGRGIVLVGGTRCRVVGSVCMDVFFCDVSAAGEVKEGDAVTVVGRDGKAAISLEEQAALAGTSPYELSCRLGRGGR